MAVVRRVALVGLGLAGGPWGCTLTADEFDPLLIGDPPTTDASRQASGDALVPGQGVGPIAPDCVQGAARVSGQCVPDRCASAEDPSACVSGLGAEGQAGSGQSGDDCGGSADPCPIGGDCIVAGDCASGSCIEGRCATPTCDDGVQNQDESGADCGGVSCVRCTAGEACNAASDCEADLFCAETCRPLSCRDGVIGGTEVGTDCGGDACPGCPVGGPCNNGLDCESRSCSPAQTCAAARCLDGILNGDESGVDCGGSCDAPCTSGEPCRVPTDCDSNVCGVVGCSAVDATCCQAPTCRDGVRNASEMAVDCGNAECGPCDVGAPCGAAGQCQSGVCGPDGSCAAASCSDGQRNGLEGDIDCGGIELGCPPCADQRACRGDADCQSGRCASGRCVSCGDGVQDGDEAGVDCGGSDPACPACIRCTEANSMDFGGTGGLTLLPANGCGKITQFPGHPPTLVQSDAFGPFPFAFEWSQGCSGQRGTGSFDGTYDQTPLAGLVSDCAVIFDFQGSAAAFGLRWY